VTDQTLPDTDDDERSINRSMHGMSQPLQNPDMNAESVSGMSIKGAEEDSDGDTDASATSEEEEEAAKTGVNPCPSN
jgi:hypothetical protein